MTSTSCTHPWRSDSSMARRSRPYASLGVSFEDLNATLGIYLRSLYVNLLDQIESHTLAVLPDTERPLPEYVADRLTLHAGIVDAIDDRDRDRALGLIARHATSDMRAPSRPLLLSHISPRVTRRSW